jgi:hypothetical protein
MGFFLGFELPSCIVSVCTSVLVPVPILISMGMGATCRFSGLSINSGDVARSTSAGSRFSTSSLARGSCVMASLISVHLAPM